MIREADVLRRWARALRASADYADSAQARGAELDRAAELERRAEAIEREANGMDRKRRSGGVR